VKRIDSDALGFFTKALGLGGSGSPQTELNDGIVDQSLDVVPLIRRGRTLAQSDGLFTAIISNIHTDAETITTSINPFAPGALAIPPFPGVIPPLFDLWLLSTTLRRQSGGGTLIATLSWQPGARNQAWGVNDSGTQVVQQDRQAIAYWDSVNGANLIFGFQANVQILHKIGMRLARGTAAFPGALTFSSVSSLTSTYNASINFGLFPVTLGQDGEF